MMVMLLFHNYDEDNVDFIIIMMMIPMIFHNYDRDNVDVP